MEFLEKDLYITYDEFEAYINGEGPQKESSFRTSGTQGKPKSLWDTRKAKKLKHIIFSRI